MHWRLSKNIYRYQRVSIMHQNSQPFRNYYLNSRHQHRSNGVIDFTNINLKINTWKSLNPSLKGEVVLINTFLLSKLWYYTQFFCLSTSFIKFLSRSIQFFLWNTKHPPCKLSKLVGPSSNGGLGLLPFQTLAKKSFKNITFLLYWIKQLH